MSTTTKAKPKIKIHPLEDRVVILPDEEAETIRGGLYIPDTAKERPTPGRSPRRRARPDREGPAGEDGRPGG
jgi:chaperonin GroES